MLNQHKENNSAPRPKILWMEDSLATIQLLKPEFELFYDVDTVTKFSDFDQLPREKVTAYDAILLDLELADGSLEDLHANFIDQKGPPVIVLSKNEFLDTRLKVLSLGAHDFLPKVMPYEEMIVRIQNVIKRSLLQSQESTMTLGNLEMDTFSVRVENKDVSFSKIELHFMFLLLQNHPHPISVDSLRQEVWRVKNLEEGTLHTFVWKMNKKLHQWQYRIRKNGEFLELFLR